MNVVNTLAAGLLLLSMTAANTMPGNADDSADSREWNFRVYLGDSEIGQHRFRLSERDGTTTLSTEADFRVRFLFFTAYRYQHVNKETWQNDCLSRIESHTDANGKVIDVAGMQRAGGFHIDEPQSEPSIPGCVKSFAYWNTGILQEDALLNPQTGELTPIQVEAMDNEVLRVRGRDVAARRYRLDTRDISLDVWYSQDSEWLALESTTRDGRTLRYELI